MHEMDQRLQRFQNNSLTVDWTAQRRDVASHTTSLLTVVYGTPRGNDGSEHIEWRGDTVVVEGAEEPPEEYLNSPAAARVELESLDPAEHGDDCDKCCDNEGKRVRRPMYELLLYAATLLIENM
jgi:hypothetical protein